MAATTLNPTQAFASARFYIGTFTRDNTVANGTQAVTGVGFTPKYVIFTSVKDATTAHSFGGYDNGTTAYCISSYGANFTNNSTESIAYFDPSNTANYNRAHITTLGTDGFTVTWTKGSSPTGTTIIYYTAFR